MLIMGEGEQAGAKARRWVHDAAVVGGVTALAVVLRARTALAPIETQDERTWMQRTSAFSDALHGGDLSQMSAAPQGIGHPQTMPGVTTMWVGTFARWVWGAGRQLSLWAGTDSAERGGGDAFETTRSGLIVAQLSMALATALLVGLVAFLVARWAGSCAGAVAGVLVATEPFVVAHGAVLHTDELMSLFGIASLVAAALMLGLPVSGEWAGHRGMALLSGGFGGAAVLTKMSALMFVAGVGLLAAWAVIRLWHRGGGVASARILRALVPVGGWWAVGFVGVVVVAYPALWARPVEEVGHLRRSTQMAGDGHLQYFLGEAVETPGPAYYLVAVPLRVTPWLLVGAAVAAVVLWWRPASRGFAVALTVMAGATFVIISAASKQFDRYGLPLIIFGAVAVGVAVSSLIRPANGRRADWLLGPKGRGALIAGAGVLLVHGLVVSPWGMAYFNPLLGGSARAERALMVGWGEGSDEVGRLIAAHAEDGCAMATVHGGAGGRSSDYRCGRSAPAGEADYVVVHISVRQRLPEDVRALVDDPAGRASRELVATVRIRGLDHFEVYGPWTEDPDSGGA